MNLATQLESPSPDEPAIIEGDRAITFGELQRRVSGGAELLRRHGLEPGQRVLVFHPIHTTRGKLS